MRSCPYKTIYPIAACALALSLFLFPDLTARAEAAAPSYDINGDEALNEKDVKGLLRCAVGLETQHVARVAAFCDRAAQAATLKRGLQRKTAALPPPLGGLEENATEEAAQRYMRTKLTIDLKPFQSALRKYRLRTYDDFASAKPVFEEMAEAFEQAAATAAEDCAATLKEELSGTANGVLTVNLPQRIFTWKEMAALYRAFHLELSGVIAETAVVNLIKTDACAYSVSLEFAMYDEIAAAGSRQQLMAAKFALTYLNTIYDAEGVFQEYEKYPFNPSYLKALIHPLEGDYLIKNGWYDGRSKGTRRHTGTDIKAPARTPIHSMTDGVVLYIGYSDVPGNYVIIRDSYGFEYHYYHMAERSKEVTEGQIVKKGDVIGLVGNTGNSAANHLHLGVVSPENTYINPYDMFLEAGIGPIRIDVE